VQFLIVLNACCTIQELRTTCLICSPLTTSCFVHLRSFQPPYPERCCSFICIYHFLGFQNIIIHPLATACHIYLLISQQLASQTRLPNTPFFPFSLFPPSKLFSTLPCHFRLRIFNTFSTLNSLFILLPRSSFPSQIHCHLLSPITSRVLVEPQYLVKTFAISPLPPSRPLSLHQCLLQYPEPTRNDTDCRSSPLSSLHPSPLRFHHLGS